MADQNTEKVETSKVPTEPDDKHKPDKATVTELGIQGTHRMTTRVLQARLDGTVQTGTVTPYEAPANVIPHKVLPEASRKAGAKADDQEAADRGATIAKG
jgi:hypothetical protein